MNGYNNEEKTLGASDKVFIASKIADIVFQARLSERGFVSHADFTTDQLTRLYMNAFEEVSKIIDRGNYDISDIEINKTGIFR